MDRSFFQMERADILLVAALDFGTAYSGYAFSFRHEFKTNPLKIHTNHWQAGSLISHKAPTSVLYDEDRRFHSFGYEAENTFFNDLSEDERGNYIFFHRFKMQLYTPGGIRRKMKIKDHKGRSMQDMTVFSDLIKYLKDHLLEDLSDKEVEGVDEDSVLFVLTVPAIWDDGAKQFMREAATKAGISKENLEIALEPEVASIYCKEVAKQTQQSTEDTSVASFPPGKQFLLLDLGGGTADITVFEVQSDNSMHEKHIATGGPWGGTCVDESFRSYLNDVLGENVMSEIYTSTDNNVVTDRLQLLRNFEIKKREVTDENVSVKLPRAILKTYKQMKNGQLKVKRQGIGFKSPDKLVFTFESFKNSFPDGCTDEDFKLFAVDIFGVDVFSKCSGIESELWDSFRAAQRRINMQRSRKILVNIPFAVREIYNRSKENNHAEEVYDRVNGKSPVCFERDKLAIGSSEFRSFFAYPIQCIKTHLEKLFSLPHLASVDTIFAVGGFSESPFVKNDLKAAFQNKLIIVPNESGLAVLCGAVLYGHMPSSISARVSRYTYGINSHVPFNPAVHAPSQRTVINGRERCDCIFKVILKKGQSIVAGQTLVKLICRTHTSQTDIELYRSDKEDPKFTNENGSRCLGEIRLNFPPVSSTTEQYDLIDVELLFGFTELRVRAKERRSGNLADAKLDFLK